MQFCCSLSGASAPLDPTYSTVQEQQTGFSTRFDDQHEFYVSIGDSPPKKSCRISLKHLKLDRCPICPRRRKPSPIFRPQHLSASLKLAISLVIHRQNIGKQSCLQIFAVFSSRNFVNNISRTIQQVRSGALDSRGGILSI